MNDSTSTTDGGVVISACTVRKAEAEARRVAFERLWAAVQQHSGAGISAFPHRNRFARGEPEMITVDVDGTLLTFRVPLAAPAASPDTLSVGLSIGAPVLTAVRLPGVTQRSNP